MPHRNAVADSYRIELERHAAGLTNGILDRPGDLIEMDMAWNYLAETVGDADKGLAHISRTDPAGMKQSPVWCSLKAFFNRITSHNSNSPKILANSFENAKIAF
jgi:hypothetical protein